jgi:hypothetical protein
MRRLVQFLMLCSVLMVPVRIFAAITQTNSTYAYNYGGSASKTTSSINTTGATLIVITCTGSQPISLVSNSGTADTWNLLDNYGDSNAGYARISFAYAPTTSSSQTFTCTLSTSGTIFVYVSVWSGTLSTGAVLQASTGQNDSGTYSTYPGSITPNTAGELFITAAISYDPNDPHDICGWNTPPTYFTAWQPINSGASGNTLWATDAAYYINSGTSIVNPTWPAICGSSPHAASAMAAFLPAIVIPPGFDGGTFETSKVDYGIGDFEGKRN